MLRFILKVLNGAISLVVCVALAAAGLYAGYALWDNQQIYSAAENVQSALLAFKPKAVEEGEEAKGPSFDELLEINEDVCGWISMDSTAIDHPILRGETNLTYINKDAFGNFALAGSIFLDCRCKKDFSQPYNLLYGHHMANHGMFGDLDLFKQEDFFNNNATGTLMIPGEVHPLRVLACMVTEASNDAIFEPDSWQDDLEKLVEYCVENALYVRQDTLEMLEQQWENERLGAGPAPRVLALSTCSAEYTNARTIVLTLIDP